MSFEIEVMQFLNEIGKEFPAAHSLASGCPADSLLSQRNSDVLFRYYRIFEAHLCNSCRSALLQYGRTAGLIAELVSQQIVKDDRVEASPDRLIVTAGCQEAIALSLGALCQQPGDSVLVCNPTYAGALGAAQAANIPVDYLNGTEDLADQITYAVRMRAQHGGHIRALYLIPTFDNPSGTVLTVAARKEVLRRCNEEKIVIVEDNPYGMFRYEGSADFPMAALDEDGCVIYLSTYSKSLGPSLRVGAATLPQTIFGSVAAREKLWEGIVARKSYLTLNTSQITQAIVGGILIDNELSLQGLIEPAVAYYRANRDIALASLGRSFKGLEAAVRWNHPQGGFFLTLDLPFAFGTKEVLTCAREHGVIVLPMRWFSLDRSQDKRVRIAFSSISPNAIPVAMNALREYVDTVIGE